VLLELFATFAPVATVIVPAARAENRIVPFPSVPAKLNPDELFVSPPVNVTLPASFAKVILPLPLRIVGLGDVPV